MIYKLLLLIVFASCASQSSLKTKLDSGKDTFVLTDPSGRYFVTREVKVQNRKLISRTKVFSIENRKQSLETSVAVSKIGVSKDKRNSALLPEASQFAVWLEKSRYTSQIRIDKNTKKFKVKTKSPEDKWNGLKLFDIPKARYFCFFSQLPDCLIMQNLLLKARQKKIPIYIIWDNFPFHSEQYEGMSKELVTLADFYYSEKDRDSLRFELDLGNQIIFYHFDRKMKFEKMFWITQGISLFRVADKVKKEQK